MFKKKKEKRAALAEAIGITEEQLSALLKAQRGELDAVWMYKRLAKKAKDTKDKDAFARLANDEGRHADVFFKRTGKKLRANPAKAILIPLLYKIIGKDKLYPIIAKAEYKAADKYKHIIADFPEVEEVMSDEVKHGDAVKGLTDEL